MVQKVSGTYSTQDVGFIVTFILISASQMNANMSDTHAKYQYHDQALVWWSKFILLLFITMSFSSAKVQEDMYRITSTMSGTVAGTVAENTEAMNLEDCSVR